MSARSLMQQRTRPLLFLGDIICARCGTACEFEETAIGGEILARARCHGEYADIKVTFNGLRLSRKKGIRLEVFEPVDSPAELTGQSASLALSPPSVLLLPAPSLRFRIQIEFEYFIQSVRRICLAGRVLEADYERKRVELS